MAKFLLFIVCVAQFFCGMASVTANSRMSFAFSRDNALPGSRIWAKVNPRTGGRQNFMHTAKDEDTTKALDTVLDE